MLSPMISKPMKKPERRRDAEPAEIERADLCVADAAEQMDMDDIARATSASSRPIDTFRDRPVVALDCREQVLVFESHLASPGSNSDVP